MRALSIRQPYAEEILRGIKTVEYRTKPTRKIGEKFFIYAGLKSPSAAELARFSKLCPTPEALKDTDLLRGVIVGTAVISKVTPPTGDMPYYHWHLTDIERLEVLMKPTRQPQPTWFVPFDPPT